MADNPWIQTWCELMPGCSLYGEVTPTQKVKGQTATYGAQPGKFKFYVFDILEENGAWAPFEVLEVTIAESNRVPLLYKGPFNLAMAKELAEGESTFAGHIREGVVIRAIDETMHVRGLGRAQLKIVSNKFLLRDSE